MFDSKKDKKINGFFRPIEGSGLYVVKIVDIKFFGNIKKKSQKWTTQEFVILQGTKS